MTGWAYKVVQETDMKFPMVFGEGKRSRLLATIGVTRGFGDHDLRAQASGTVYIKPFLTPQPEVGYLHFNNKQKVVHIRQHNNQIDFFGKAGLISFLYFNRFHDFLGSSVRCRKRVSNRG